MTESKRTVSLYIEEYRKWEEKVGEKAIVLWQVGSFYEAYSLIKTIKQKNNAITKTVYGCARKLADALDMQIAQKKKPVEHEQAGFGIAQLNARLQDLTDLGFQVLVYNQHLLPNGKFERKLEMTVTKGTFSKNTNTLTNWLLLIYFQSIRTRSEEIPESLRNEPMVIGIAMIDISTGKSYLAEGSSTKSNVGQALDSAFGIISKYRPRELLIYTKDVHSEFTEDDFKTELRLSELEDGLVRFHINKVSKEMTGSRGHQRILEKVYTRCKMLPVLEYLGLSQQQIMATAFCLLIDYLFNLNENDLSSLPKPKLLETQKSELSLEGNTVRQLNLVTTERRYQSEAKFKSVFDVLNKCCTVLGKRELYQRLIVPTTKVSKINRRYDSIQEFIDCDKGVTAQIHEQLKQICDIEKFQRYLVTRKLTPNEFTRLYASYKTILDLHTLMEQHRDKFSVASRFLLKPQFKKMLQDFVDESIKFFDIDSMAQTCNLGNCSYKNITQTAYIKPGNFEDIDEVCKKVTERNDILQKQANLLSNLIEKNSNYVTVKLIKLDKKPVYVFETTKTRGEVLKKIKRSINIENESNRILNSAKKLSPEEINLLVDCTFSAISGKYRLHTKQTKEFAEKQEITKTELFSLTQEHYLNLAERMGKNYRRMFFWVMRFVFNTDIAHSLANVAVQYHYCRPITVVTDEANQPFIDAKGLRHALIERNLLRLEYIPNDIILGTDDSNGKLVNGVLLYGVNASGKSSMLRSVGVAVVMAQLGSFVAAESFRYCPFQTIFSRIAGGDDILNNKSTFEIEMIELGSILRQANIYSLVLTDELTHGTECVSGSSIISNAVVALSKKGCKFVFSTHLHGLMDFPEVKALNDVVAFHSSITRVNGTVVYDRKLKPGCGETFYGIEIAEALLPDQKEFVHAAYKTRNYLINKPDHLASQKKSSYNAAAFVENECAVCGKISTKEQPHHQHHIAGQCLADKNGHIGHISKHSVYNQVTLCTDCHLKRVHGSPPSVIIKGWKSTTEGMILDWSPSIDINYVV